MTVNFTNGWFADRAPGLGKRLIVSGNTVGLSGVVIVGQPSTGGGSTNPPGSYAPLPPAGSTIPPIGNPGRAPYFLAFKEAVGFDGSTYLTGPATGGTGTKISISVWVNAGVSNVPGFTPDPTKGTLWESGQAVGHFTNVAFGPTPGVSTAEINVPSTGYSYPSDGTTNAGWVHVMLSLTATFSGGNFSQRALGYINDTPWVNQTLTGSTLGETTLNFATNAIIGGEGNFDGTIVDPGFGLKLAMTEYWVKSGVFIDWSIEANRYKFQVTDGVGALQTWAPCDLGTNGSAPGFGVPLAYLSGGSSLFPKNRAAGGAALTVNTTTTGLFDVDDPPS